MAEEKFVQEDDFDPDFYEVEDEADEEPQDGAVATPLVDNGDTDPEEDAAKDDGVSSDYPEPSGHQPDVDFAREV